MAYIWQRSLADDLRAAGLTVIEVPGWRNRGRPASTGHFNPDGASTAHHTGVTSSRTNPAPGLQTLIHGRTDLPGPLCQVATDYLGRVHVIAAGRANHAGRVGKRGVHLMPFGADGNALAIGNEVITDGTQQMPAEQYRATVTVHAVLARRSNRWAPSVHRHEDISATGKWDLGGVTTAQLRADVSAEIRRLNASPDRDLAKVIVEARKATHKAVVALRDARRAVNAAAVEARRVGRPNLARNLVKRRKRLNNRANLTVNMRKWLNGRAVWLRNLR